MGMSSYTDAATGITLAIQIDGATIASFVAGATEAQATVEERARAVDAVKRSIEGKTVTVVYEAGKFINFITQAPAA